jgi:MFS family permease
MQGRVFTLMISISSAMTPLSLLVAGPISDRFGVQKWFVVGGLATLMIAMSSIFVPAIMNIEKGRPGAEQALKPAEVSIASAADVMGD